MALELVGGAVVGAVIGELLKAVLEAKDKASNFRHILASVEDTLKAIIPRLDEISRLNHMLNLQQNNEMEELIGLANNGKELVLKCSKISTFSLIRKQQYSKELLHLDYTLLRYLMTILQLDQSRDNKELLVMVRELHMKLASDKHETISNNQSESIKPVKKDLGSGSHKMHQDSGSGELVRPPPYLAPPPVYSISPNGKFRNNIESWQKGDLLGRGVFGTVYKGYIIDNGLCFAVKEVSLLDIGIQFQQTIHQLEQEISFLSQFEHENIVQYLGTQKDEARLYIFLELVTKGSLASLYQKYNLRNSQVSAYTRQILNGLKYLHERNVVHRDIKCANILVDASGSVKLADFGLAKIGTAFWMAPEVVCRKNGYGLAADIWSLGCTVLEMLTRQIPYSHLEGVQAVFRIGKGDPPPVPNSLSSDARDFIFKCLQFNPDNRPTAAQLLEHSFVKIFEPSSSKFKI